MKFVNIFKFLNALILHAILYFSIKILSKANKRNDVRTLFMKGIEHEKNLISGLGSVS